MTNILCQINDVPFTSKPTDQKVMGKLRDKMIMKPWDYLNEYQFLQKVTSGYAFYGCIFNGHDLLNASEGRQRACWRAQTIVAVDIDKCPVHPLDMIHFYFDLGYIPWAAYRTFSDDPENGSHSYRIMWRVDVDHNISYEQWADVIKGLSGLSEYGDNRARDCSRMWQGTNTDLIWHVPGLSWTYNELASKLGLTKGSR